MVPSILIPPARSQRVLTACNGLLHSWRSHGKGLYSFCTTSDHARPSERWRMVRNGSRINEIYQSHIRPVKPGVFEGYFRFLVGADGGGRTHTPLRVPDFESSASANSATSATRV